MAIRLIQYIWADKDGFIRVYNSYKQFYDTTQYDNFADNNFDFFRTKQ